MTGRRGGKGRPTRTVLRTTTVCVPGPTGLEDRTMDLLACGHMVPNAGTALKARKCAPCRSKTPPDFDPEDVTP